MATKLDKYKPSGKKLLMAKRLADPDFQGTITDLCAQVGVARSTFYDWIGDENFRSYVDELIDKYTDSELSRVWKALMKLIDKGDFQAIKLYFELKGKYKDTVGRSNAKKEQQSNLLQLLAGTGEDIDTDDLPEVE